MPVFTVRISIRKLTPRNYWTDVLCGDFFFFLCVYVLFIYSFVCIYVYVCIFRIEQIIMIIIIMIIMGEIIIKNKTNTKTRKNV